MLSKQGRVAQDVAAIITAMTDKEQPFLHRTLEAVLAEPEIGQVVLCIEEKNTWVDATLGTLKDDPRLEIVRIPMSFSGEARNKGLEPVRLPWVAYCDGDDVWCKGKTFEQRAWANKTNSDFVGADHYLMSEEDKICAFAFARNIPMTSSWMVRTEVMRQHPFDGSLPILEDGEWWTRTTPVVRKARCPKMLLKYRVRSGSLSSGTPSKRRKAKVMVFASLPILRQVILLLTWCIWQFTRRRDYIWLESWGQEPVMANPQPSEAS